MGIAPRNRTVVLYLLSFLLMFGLNLFLVYSRSPAFAQQAAQASDAGEQMQENCPGERMGVQATGTYQSRPVPEAVINGEPWGGAYWEAGMLSYWHCHRGGQLMMVWEGEGRVQKRGERVRILSVGETEYAGPWMEHWHGASPDSDAQYVQISFQPTGTYWMEEVGRDDYLGNDIGTTTRNEFLQTGIREQSQGR